jgi:hypothetical protein
MCGGKKFEFGTEPLVIWKADTKSDANLSEPDRGRISAFAECKDCNITRRIRMQQTLSLINRSIFQYQFDHWNFNGRFIYR